MRLQANMMFNASSSAVVTAHATSDLLEQDHCVKEGRMTGVCLFCSVCMSTLEVLDKIKSFLVSPLVPWRDLQAARIGD